MEFGKFNQAPNSKCHDFDLNIPYLEDLNSNDINHFSPIIQNNTESTENMNITTANNENKQVHPAGSTFLTNFVTGVSVDDAKQVHPMIFIDSPSVDGYQGIKMGGRRRYRRRGRALPTDQKIFCTNFHCKTRKTPMWRKGPLGPKTLCNACGIYYKKLVTSGGNNIPAIIIRGDASSSDVVPPGFVEGDSSNF